MEKLNKRELIIIFIVVSIILVLMITGIYRCPFEYILGIPCPTCGISRAIISLFHLEIAKSFYYYALWPLVLLFLIFIFLIWIGKIKVSKKTFNIICIVLGLIIIIYYIYRHIIGSNLVEIDFKNSLIYKTLFM